MRSQVSARAGTQRRGRVLLRTAAQTRRRRARMGRAALAGASTGARARARAGGPGHGCPPRDRKQAAAPRAGQAAARDLPSTSSTILAVHLLNHPRRPPPQPSSLSFRRLGNAREGAALAARGRAALAARAKVARTGMRGGPHACRRSRRQGAPLQAEDHGRYGPPLPCESSNQPEKRVPSPVEEWCAAAPTVATAPAGGSWTRAGCAKPADIEGLTKQSEERVVSGG